MSVLENIALNMNIQNNTSGPQKGSGSINNAKNEILKDIASRLISALESGDSEAAAEIKAEVRDILQNQVTLELSDSSLITGRTDTLLPLSIGDTASFKATMTPGGELTLSLISTDQSAAGQDSQMSIDNPLVKKALTAANIPANPRSLLVTSELISAGQAVNAANIRKFITLSIKNPDIPVKDLVLLSANKVPMTPSNLQAFSQLAKGDTVWSELDGSVADTTIAQNSTLVQDNAVFQNTALSQDNAASQNATLNQDNALFQNSPMAQNTNISQDSTVVKATPLSQDTALSQNMDASQDIALSRNMDASQDTAISQGTTLSQNTAAALTSDAVQNPPSAEPEAVVSGSQENITPGASPEKTSHPQPIEPRDFSEKAVKKFYDALKNTETNQAEKAPAPQPSDKEPAALTEKNIHEAAEKAVQNNVSAGTAEKIQFMQDINNVFPFIQIPVKLQEENAKGELYVFEKKKKYNPDEPLTAVLHLELESLGTTDIKVSLYQNKVTALFEVASDDSVSYFKDELESLSERIEKLGFTLSSDFKVKEPASEEKPLLYQFLEAHSPRNYSRYTFDVHA